MADVNRGNRPLSPHLQSMRPQLTSMTSILTRITGNALIVGMLLIVWWLLAAATSAESFATADAVLTSWFGDLVMFLSLLGALVSHACGHAAPDLGSGQRARSRYRREAGLRGDRRIRGPDHPYRHHHLRSASWLIMTDRKRAEGWGSAKSGTRAFLVDDRLFRGAADPDPAVHLHLRQHSRASLRRGDGLLSPGLSRRSSRR